ncbi:chaplin [Streptomyces sp. NPDC087903]|uniref:chaplin n=1 Tax=Streptomyces sp. NPDC087903 TaxID=3365819 RepID=UPI003804C735
MRQTLSRGMVAAAAATSILSLCGSPAVADTQANAAATDSPGVLSGNNVQVPVEVPVNACGNSADGVAALNPTFGNSCANDEDSHRSGSHGAPRAESGHGPRHGSGHGHDGHGPRHGSISGSSHDSDRGSGQGAGHGHDSGRDFGHSAGQDSGSGSDFGHRSGPDDGYDSGYGYGSGHDRDFGQGHGRDMSEDDAPRPTGSGTYGRTEGSPGVGSGDNVQAPIDLPVNLCGNTVDVISALNPVFGNDCDNGQQPPAGYGDTPPSPPRHSPPPSHPPTGDEHPGTPPTSGWHPGQPPSGGEHLGTPPSLAHTGSESLLAASGAAAALVAGGSILYRRGRVTSRR